MKTPDGRYRGTTEADRSAQQALQQAQHDPAEKRISSCHVHLPFWHRCVSPSWRLQLPLSFRVGSRLERCM